MADHVLKFSLHTIHHTCPISDKRVQQAAGEVFPVDPEQVPFLESTGALREPTERELLCYKADAGQLVEAASQAPDPTPTPTPAPTGKTGAADKGDAKGDTKDLVG